MKGVEVVTVGQTLLLDDEPWTVIAMRTEGVLLRSLDTGEPQTITFPALLATARLPTSEDDVSRTKASCRDQTALLQGVDADETKRVLELEGHLMEVAEQVARGARTADAISGMALKLGVCDRTVWNHWKQWQEGGIWALVDRRKVRVCAPPAADTRLVEAIRNQATMESHDSTGTYKRFVRRLRRRLEKQCGPDVVPVPASRTLRRVIDHHTGNAFIRDARRQQTDANQPQGLHGHPAADRPGQFVLFDTNRLDVLAYDPKTDRVSSLELTVAIDLHTRSILAWRTTPVGTTATDSSLMLADIVMPEPMRPGWQERASFRALRIPWEVGLDLQRRLADMAAKPVIMPETVVVDHGKIFVGRAFREACSRLGISLQPVHVGTPTDKGAVERWFRTLNEDIVSHIAGYTGYGVQRRGRRADDAARWTLAEIDEFIAEYIVSVYQNRRHDSLRPQADPDTALSPNEMFGMAIAASGALPLPTDPDLYFELLPVHWGVIGPGGMKYRGLKYDGSAFNDCRRKSDYAHKNGKWPVRIDPRDRSAIYFKNPADGKWEALLWIYADDVTAPFSDRSLNYLRAVLASRGDDPRDQQLVADLLTELQNRADASEMSTARDRRTLTVDREKACQAALDRAGTSLPKAHLTIAPAPIDEWDESEESDGWAIDYDSLEPFPTINRRVEPMSAAHFSDEPNPGMGEPETKELWRRYVFESPPPPPPLPSYRDFKCLEPDDAEDLHDARCDYHSALVVVDTPALSALDGAVKRRLRANRRALAGARRSIALDGVAESGKSTAVKQIGRSVELKLRARHPDWFGGAARTSRQSPT